MIDDVFQRAPVEHTPSDGLLRNAVLERDAVTDRSPTKVEWPFDEVREPQHVLVCLDRSSRAQHLIEHANAVARAWSGRMTLIHALEPGGCPNAPAPTNAIDWRLRRQEAECFLSDIAADCSGRGVQVDTELAEGRAFEQIRAWIRHHDVDLTVLSTHADGPCPNVGLGATARKLIDGLDGSIFLIPGAAATAKPSQELRYNRIMVPLDGSAHAESVLPLAVRLALDHRAELILAHVVPEPELMRVGPPNVADAELAATITTRNAEIATRYLGGLRAQLSDPALRVRTCLRRHGNPCDELLQIVDEEEVDLVLLSAHGRTGATDRALGSVATHLVTYASVPTLLSRRRVIGQHEWVHTAPGEQREEIRAPHIPQV